MLSVTSLADVVDLDRYPVDRLDSPAGQNLVARCRRELAAAGASDLDGFIRPAAVASTVNWAILAMPKACRTDTEHNVYFTDDESGLPAGDPRRIRVRSAKGALTYDQIPPGSPLRVAYESAELTAFAGAALGRDTLYRHADKLGALNVMYYSQGDELGWHFDGAGSVVTLMLQAPSKQSAPHRRDLLWRPMRHRRRTRVMPSSADHGVEQHHRTTGGAAAHENGGREGVASQRS